MCMICGILLLLCRLSLLFWTDFVEDTVNQAPLDGSDATVIASGVDNPGNLVGIAMHSPLSKLFSFPFLHHSLPRWTCC